MKYVLSLSGGKDSMAMFIRVTKEKYPLDYVVFCDTGMEFQAIYHNISEVREVCQKMNIEFIHLHLARPFLYDMLEKPINTKNGEPKRGRSWCGGLCRWGTAEKREAFNRFYRTLDDTVVEYVGIAADETHRINRSKRTDTVKLYPLVEWGMSEKDCLEYCYEHGVYWNENGIELYSILDRVSCWCCSNKNKKELQNMFNYLPDYWDRLCILQSKIKQPFKSYANLFELTKEFQGGNDMNIGKINDIYIFNGEFYVVLNKGYVYSPTGLHYFTYTEVLEAYNKLNDVVSCSCNSCTE